MLCTRVLGRDLLKSVSLAQQLTRSRTAWAPPSWSAGFRYQIALPPPAGPASQPGPAPPGMAPPPLGFAAVAFRTGERGGPPLAFYPPHEFYADSQNTSLGCTSSTGPSPHTTPGTEAKGFSPARITASCIPAPKLQERWR